MHKRLLFGLALFGLLTILFASCSIRDTAISGPTVHMGPAAFIQTSITIPKGSPLILVDDVSVQHIIKNGSWAGSNQEAKVEPGAPTVDVTYNGNDSAPVGPFTTAGTFHLYCTIHPGMNLTVTVQ
jgi:plastocyanin